MIFRGVNKNDFYLTTSQSGSSVLPFTMEDYIPMQTAGAIALIVLLLLVVGRLCRRWLAFLGLCFLAALVAGLMAGSETPHYDE